MIMVRRILVGVLFFSAVAASAAKPVLAQCPVPQFVSPANLQIHKVGESFPVLVKHAQNSKVEFKFEYRNINTKLFGDPNPYQPDNYTKIANIVQSFAVDAPSTTAGTITEIQSGFWKVYARSRCMLGQPNKQAPQPTAVSDWSAPLEYIILESNSTGIFASARLSPATFSGACPVTICADAAIQSYYRNPASFSWLLSDGKTAPGGSMGFSSPLEIKVSGQMCFPVGVTGGPGYQDPPHSGKIYLIVNGNKGFDMPVASYQVNCAEPFKKSNIKIQNFDGIKTRKKLP